MKKRYNITITKKIIIFISCFALISTLAVSFIIPHLLYHITKSQIANNITQLTNSNALRQSYIWRGNRIAFSLSADKELSNWISEYYMPESNDKNEAKDQILSKLLTQGLPLGKGSAHGSGSISTVSYSMLYTSEGDAFYQSDAQNIATIVLESEWIHSLSMDMNRSYSPVIHSTSNKTPTNVMCFVIPFEVNGIQCYAIHMLDFSDILAQFKDLEAAGVNDFMLLQSDQILYQNSDYNFKWNDYPDYMYQGLQYETTVLEKQTGMDFMVLCSYETENYRLIAFADKETLLLPYKQIFLLIEWLIYGIIMILLIIVLFFLKGIFKRLINLTQKMHAVKEGNYNTILEDYGNDEVSNLIQTFNIMIETIRLDIAHKDESKKREQEMQYRLMVSAIDPHFIYNTLNTINFLALMNETDDIVSVNTALIDNLRDRLSIKNYKTFDRIQTEKEVLEQYIVIQHFLCHNTIDYSFEASEDDLQIKIPKNIIQPLVENCIKHGLLPHKHPETHKIMDGIIKITVKRLNDKIQIIITDNGIGMNHDQIHTFFNQTLPPFTKNADEHIGIYNIRMRLSYLYKDKYELHAQSELERGTIVTLILPSQLL